MMSAKLMLGKETAQAIKEDLSAEVERLKEVGDAPLLSVIRVGEKPEDIAYERGAAKRLDSIGIAIKVTALPEGTSQIELENVVTTMNDDPKVHGILIFRPLPEGLDEEKICNMIDPAKDVDCLSPVNMARILAGDPKGFAPCTAEAAVEIGRRNGIDFTGKKVTIIGRSMVVGRPLAMMLLKEDATVTVCHSHTDDLMTHCKDADVIISAAGCAGLITGDMVKPGAAVIDIGINVLPDGKLTGDVDFDAAEKKASMITPVPGGVGGVTTSVLAEHVVRAAEDAENK